MSQPKLLAVAITAVLLAACSRKEAAPPAAAAESAPAAEAAPAPASTSVKAFQIGALSALALRDGGFEMPNDNQVLGVGLKPEDVAAVLGANGLPTDKLNLSIQPLLVKTPDRVLLFDTGASGNFGPTAGQLGASLAEAGVAPASITDIFISHVHGDHIGGLLDAQGALAFANATIHISAAEWQFLKEVNADTAKAMGLANRDALVKAFEPKVAAFKAGAELLPGIVTAVDIQGHTPGHSAYKILSGTESILYIGDSMHHHVISVQKPEWVIAYDHDSGKASASRAALIAQAAADGQRIFAVHFPFPGIGKFEKRGDVHVWVAE